MRAHDFAEHLNDGDRWWMDTYGGDSPETRETMRMIAYERWLNDRPLLSTESPVTEKWYERHHRASVTHALAGADYRGMEG